jgi:hypothetical protein
MSGFCHRSPPPVKQAAKSLKDDSNFHVSAIAELLCKHKVGFAVCMLLRIWLLEMILGISNTIDGLSVVQGNGQALFAQVQGTMCLNSRRHLASEGGGCSVVQGRAA